jgi:hypothetical protein
MLRKLMTRLGAALAVVAVIGLAAVPAASAQEVTAPPRGPGIPVGGPMAGRVVAIEALLPAPVGPPVAVPPPLPPPPLPTGALPVLQQLFPEST